MVGKKIVKISIKSTVRAQRTDTKRKTRLVYLDEKRDSMEGEGGGETPPPTRGRGIENRQDLQTTAAQRAGGIQ